MKKYFGDFGGQYVPETLMNPLIELEKVYTEAISDPEFIKNYKYYLKEYAGRPTPLYYAEKLTQLLGGGKIYLKREDLNHTGSHKLNNVLGQVLLAKRMGKKKVTAETGAGQHGVATATVAALFGIDCQVFMGEEDIQRQAVNVSKMKLLGAEVTPVHSGTSTLKDATSAAIRDWVAHVDDTFYVIGSTMGPHPYPSMVRDFQRIIGDEAKEQISEKTGQLPNHLIACIGGGSNSMGLFYPFIENAQVKMHAVEAAGLGIDTDMHAAAIARGSIGIIHGMKTYLLQDDFGQILPAYSISAGLDYPGIGPEHAYFYTSKRVNYVSATDQEALEAFRLLTRYEGIIPALESSHALAYLRKLAPVTSKEEIIIVNLSGRGDKDMDTVLQYISEDKEAK